MLGVSFATKDGRQERFAVESEVGPSDVSFVDKAKRVQFDLLRGSDDASSPIYDYNVALNGEGAHWFAPKTMVDATLRDSKGKPSVVISRSNGMGATMDSADAVECVRSEVADQLRIQLLFSGGAPVNLTMPSIECTQAD
jgi:hypothetical protein